MNGLINRILAKNNIKGTLLGIFIYSALLLLMSFISLEFTTWAQINGIFLVFCVSCFMIQYYKGYKTIFSPFLLFYVIFLAFTSGHIFLMAIGIDPIDISYIWTLDNFSHNNVFIGITFTIYSIQFFHLGYFISKKLNCKIKILNNLKLPKVDWQLIINYIFYLCIISSIIYVMYIKYKTSDYSSIYNTSFGMIYNILYLISLFSIPTYLLINMNYKKVEKKSTFLMLVAIILNFVIGKRGMAIMFLIPIFFVYIQNLKNIKVTQIALLMLFAYMMINLVVTISYTRIADIDIFKFFESYVYYFISFKSIGLLINEMGFSIRPLIEVINLISDNRINPTYGGTYLYSFFLILPGFLRFGLDSFAIEHNLINLASMVTNYSGANFGIGFSVMAEAYLNFQYFGIFFFILLGIVLGKLLDGKIFKDDKMNYFFHVSVISILIVFPRSPMQDTIKKLLYYSILPFLLYSILLEKEKTNEAVEKNN